MFFAASVQTDAIILRGRGRRNMARELNMTPYEICESYRTAANPNKQITVLAQLNCCLREDIIEILQENNEPLKKRLYNRSPKKEQAPQETAPEHIIRADYIESPSLPESVEDAIRRRIAELDETIANIRNSLEKNENQKEELQDFLWRFTKAK